MSIALVASVAAMAVRQGPNVIRGIASLFGGNDTADKVANIVEQVGSIAGISPEQKVAKVAEKIAALPPEVLLGLEQLKVELEKEQTRRQELDNQRFNMQLSDQQSSHHETQETIRNGDNAADEEVRRTRPMMARLALYGAMSYAIGFELAEAFGHGKGAEFDLLFYLLTPVWTYMGARTIDGFAPYSKASGDKVLNLVKRK